MCSSCAFSLVSRDTDGHQMEVIEADEESPAELKGGQVEVDRAELGPHKGVQLCAGGAWEAAA